MAPKKVKASEDLLDQLTILSITNMDLIYFIKIILNHQKYLPKFQQIF